LNLEKRSTPPWLFMGSSPSTFLSTGIIHINLSCDLFQRNRFFGARFADIEQIGRVFAQIKSVHRKKPGFFPLDLSRAFVLAVSKLSTKSF
jgi:hypothetical protein